MDKVGAIRAVFQTKRLEVGISTPVSRKREKLPTPLSPTCGVPTKPLKKDIISALAVLCLLLDPVGQLRYLVVNRTSLRHQLPDLSISMHDCGVVAASESLADLWQR